MNHVKDWSVRLDLAEADDEGTSARACLDTGANVLRAEGHARAAEGNGIAEIQDELAAGRALLNLAHQLIGYASADTTD